MSEHTSCSNSSTGALFNLLMHFSCLHNGGLVCLLDTLDLSFHLLAGGVGWGLAIIILLPATPCTLLKHMRRRQCVAPCCVLIAVPCALLCALMVCCRVVCGALPEPLPLPHRRRSSSHPPDSTSLTEVISSFLLTGCWSLEDDIATAVAVAAPAVAGMHVHEMQQLVLVANTTTGCCDCSQYPLLHLM